MPEKIVTRTQTGVRIESSLLKVLKALAEYTDLSLGDLLEGIVSSPFTAVTSQQPIATSSRRNNDERCPTGLRTRPSRTALRSALPC